jgi:probable F420-dependent oxidoreductase
MTDPILGMSWAAAATKTIEIGSAILILPQRNPVVLAKQLSSLDVFSGGRVVIGAGSGWSAQEYAAVNADWHGRGRRMDEYTGVLRTLWRDTPANFHGETIHVDRAYLLPKPVKGNIPILFGGECDAVLDRIARLGDGWISLTLTPEAAPERIALLRRLAREHGRDPDCLRIVKFIVSQVSLDDMKRYRDAGVTEFNLACFGELPTDDAGLTRKIEELAERFVVPAAAL